MWRTMFGMLTVMSVAAVAWAQEAPAAAQDEEAQYRQVIDERASGIVEGLNLNDADRELKVHEILIGYYPKLRDYHDEKGPKLRELEQEAGRAREAGDEAAAEAAEKQIEEIRQERQQLREEFVRQLGEVLSDEEIDRVKDGMTYNLVEHRWNLFNRIELSEAQQQEIREILEAAREEAFDEAGSGEKHAAFRRAVGRINVRVLTEEQRAELAESR